MDRIEDMNLFEHLEQWAHENTSTLMTRGLHLSINYGPADRDKRVARIDMDSPTRLVQLLLWDSGEAELLVAELEGDDDLIANEHLEITSRFGLVEALTSAVAWAGVEAVDP